MKLLVLLIASMLLVSACSKGNFVDRKVSEEGLCDGLSPKMDKLNDALLIDGGPVTTVAGEEAIAGFDAGCYGTVD
jgi:hypothetical protein